VVEGFRVLGIVLKVVRILEVVFPRRMTERAPALAVSAVQGPRMVVMVLQPVHLWEWWPPALVRGPVCYSAQGCVAVAAVVVAAGEEQWKRDEHNRGRTGS
jgi:hypothetical protein